MEKEAYVSPTLEVHARLRDITAASSGGYSGDSWRSSNDLRPPAQPRELRL